MKFTATKICTDCGTRSETRELTGLELTGLLQPMAEAIMMAQVMGQSPDFINDLKCANCSGKPTKQIELEGIERAYAPRPERPVASLAANLNVVPNDFKTEEEKAAEAADAALHASLQAALGGDDDFDEDEEGLEDEGVPTEAPPALEAAPAKTEEDEEVVAPAPVPTTVV